MGNLSHQDEGKWIQIVYGPVTPTLKKGKAVWFKRSKMYCPDLKNPKNFLDFQAIAYEKSKNKIDSKKMYTDEILAWTLKNLYPSFAYQS